MLGSGSALDLYARLGYPSFKVGLRQAAQPPCLGRATQHSHASCPSPLSNPRIISRPPNPISSSIAIPVPPTRPPR
jgi:hypothetical protein